MTPEARTKLTELTAKWLEGGQLTVFNDNTRATVPAQVTVREPGVIVVEAVFDELTGNFDWKGRDITAGDGTLFDRLEGADLGEKPIGSVWEVSIPVDVL